MGNYQKYLNTMNIKKPKLVMLGFLFLLLGAASSFADVTLDTSKLEGQWKMSDKPIWVDINFTEEVGQGQIIRHKNDPSAVGKLLLSSIVKGSDKNFWNGFIYVPQLSRVHPMKLSLVGSQEINIKVKVGFIKKTVILYRVND
ncbi:MAG: hypothetical protein CMK34_04390 [Porticoccaceae bacterium]|nr:hypothetical protein [Porticoccaceae bacterium]